MREDGEGYGPGRMTQGAARPSGGICTSRENAIGLALLFASSKVDVGCITHPLH